MAGTRANAKLHVGAVDQVTRRAQGELERPQWVIGAGRHHVGQRITVGGVLGLDRGRWRPGRVGRLGDDTGMSNRRAPAFSANTQREGIDDVLAFWIVVKPVFRQVDHNAFPRPGRQDKACGQHNLGARSRQPGINTRVGRDHFRIAQVVGSTQVGKGVFVLGLDHLDLTDNVLTGRWQGQLQGRRRTRRTKRSKRQAAGDDGKARQHPENPSQDDG